MGPGAMILIFWMMSFKPTFSLSSFSFTKRLFSSYSLSAIRVVSSAYLRLMIFLPAILIPASASCSPTFYMMYSAYKLNKQGDNIQSWRTPFPIWNQFCSMSSSNRCFLTCIQISLEAGQVVWYPHLFQNFPQFTVRTPNWECRSTFSWTQTWLLWESPPWQVIFWLGHLTPCPIPSALGQRLG